MRRAFIAATAAGFVAAAIGLSHRFSSLATTVVMLVVVLALAFAIDMPAASRRLLVVAAALFAPWLAWRSSPWLLVPDVVALVVVVAVGLSSRNGSGVRDSAAGYRDRAWLAVVAAVETPIEVARAGRAVGAEPWRRSVRPVVGPAAVGVALAALVAVVLASGDALFASYLDLGDALGSVVGRFVSAALGVSAVATGASIAARSPRREPIAARSWASPRSAIIALAPVCGVYVAYVAVQCSTLLLGADYVRDRTGLTFAEYARSGFFQLVAVGVLTFVGLTAIRPIARTATARERRTLRWLGALATICTLAMVVAAIVKLDLYSDVFGLTMLRLHTTVFAGWLGLALLIAMWSLIRLDGEWVVPVVGITALAGVLCMNAVNPERVVAEHNLTATIDSPEFDVAYLLSLSDDAVPTIVDHLDELDATDRLYVQSIVCSERRDTSGLDWNRSTAAAADAAAQACTSG